MLEWRKRGNLMNAMYLETPIGPLTVWEQGGAIVRVDFGKTAAETEKTALLAEAERQLTAYFAGELREFSLPLKPAGTDFQRKVWDALREIPYGETRSYAEIAARVGCPRGYRAVGLANNRNPIPILIPCHRVVGANGALTGYAGGLAVKEALLRLEGVRL